MSENLHAVCVCVCVCVCVSHTHTHTNLRACAHETRHHGVASDTEKMRALRVRCGLTDSESPHRSDIGEPTSFPPTCLDWCTVPLCPRRACRKRSPRRVHVRRTASYQRGVDFGECRCRRSLPSSARRGAPSLGGSSYGNQRRHHRRWHPGDMHTRDMRRFAFRLPPRTLPSHPHLGQLHCDRGSGLLSAAPGSASPTGRQRGEAGPNPGHTRNLMQNVARR